MRIVNAIKKSLERPEKVKKLTMSNTKSMDLKTDIDSPNFVKNNLFEGIPKTNIKFKNNFELEAEKEQEDSLKLTSKDDDELDASENNLFNYQKSRRTVIQMRTMAFGNKDNDVK